MLSPRRILPSVPTLAALLLLLSGVLTQPAYAQPARSSCIVVEGGPAITCLRPSEIVRVHTLFPAAIDPTASVRAVSGLRFATANIIYNRQSRAIAVQYYYGAARAFHTVSPIAARPTFLMVAESVGRLDPHFRLWDNNTRWGHYRGFLPRRNLSLVVFGNVRQQVVRQIVSGVRCPLGTICDAALGIELTPAPDWRVLPASKIPPRSLGFYVPTAREDFLSVRLVITPDGTTRTRNDVLAASRAADALTRGYTHMRPALVRIPVRYGGAPGVMILNLPGQPTSLVEIVLAHAGKLYLIAAPGQASLAVDQRRVLASLRFMRSAAPPVHTHARTAPSPHAPSGDS